MNLEVLPDAAKRRGKRLAARAPPDYQSADENDRIINLRDLGHVMRGLSEGRGSQQRVLIVLSKISGAISQRDPTERLGIQPGSAGGQWTSS